MEKYNNLDEFVVESMKVGEVLRYDDETIYEKKFISDFDWQFFGHENIIEYCDFVHRNERDGVQWFYYNATALKVNGGYEVVIRKHLNC